MKFPKTIRYKSFDQDFAETRNQDFHLPENYQWPHSNPFYRFFAMCFYPIVVLFSLCYLKLTAHITIKNRYLLRHAREGYFLYVNHTQWFGDVVNPFVLTFAKHPYIICSPANLGIPIIGKALPMAGALPIPDNLHDMKKLNDAIEKRIKQKKAIVVYPESHMWPYYTGVRPFNPAAFHYPAKLHTPIYVATTTYKKSIYPWRKKPKITIYIDGPFYDDEDAPRKQNINDLMRYVQLTMKRRCKHSTYEYIKYKQKS